MVVQFLGVLMMEALLLYLQEGHIIYIRSVLNNELYSDMSQGYVSVASGSHIKSLWWVVRPSGLPGTLEDLFGKQC